jgi:hypothetical protein
MMGTVPRHHLAPITQGARLAMVVRYAQGAAEKK